MLDEESIDWRKLKCFARLPLACREKFMARVDAFHEGWLRDNVRIVLVVRREGRTKPEEIEVFPHRVGKTYTGFEITARITAVTRCQLFHVVFIVLMDTGNEVEEVLLDAKRRDQRLLRGEFVNISYSKVFR